MFSKVAKNSLLLSSSQVVARGIGFLYVIFLARNLGVEKFGTYTFILAFLYNFIPVADFGIEKIVMRDIARKEQTADYYFARLLPLRLVLAVLAIIGALILGIVLGLSRQYLVYLFVIGISLIPYNLTYLVASFANARERMEVTAVANIAIIALTAAIGTFFIFLKLPLIWIFSSYLWSNLAVMIGLLFFSRIMGLRQEWCWDLGFVRKILTQSWVFAVLTIMAVFYLRLSVILLGVLQGSAAVGIYGSVFKFVEAGILIPQSLALALFPLSSRLLKLDKRKLGLIYCKGILVLFALSLPAAAIFVLFPRIIVTFVYGSSYLPAVNIMPVLGLSLVLFFINALAGNIIQNSAMVKRFLPAAGLNFAVALVLCLWLIPKYSILGAAWAVVGAELAGLIINNWFVWRILK